VLEHLEHLEGGAVPVEGRRVSRVLRVEQTMGYKEVEGAPLGRTEYSPPTYFLSTTY